jgi:hypothetical protein
VIERDTITEEVGGHSRVLRSLGTSDDLTDRDEIADAVWAWVPRSGSFINAPTQFAEGWYLLTT